MLTESSIEQRAKKAEDLSFCNGINLMQIKEKVSKILNFIGKNNIFNEYTKHDISHVDGMLGIIEWLIPKKTQAIMTDAEYLMLVLAVYFHDMGMMVTASEFDNRENSGFVYFKETYLASDYVVNLPTEQDKERFIYQEFVRKNHATRIKKWLSNERDGLEGEALKIIELIQDIIKPFSSYFKKQLGILCESHHYENIDDTNLLLTDARFGNTSREKVNMHYLAVILRVADLLHITSDRAPSIEYTLFQPTNPVSMLEWQKQMAVQAVTAMEKEKETDTLGQEILPDTIQITAYFSNAEMAESYFGLMAYIKYAKSQIQYCYDSVVKVSKIKNTEGYLFPWRDINTDRIETNGFEQKKLQFTINQDSILNLLIGHTLYNDASVVFRELVQNSLDAIRLQKYINEGSKKEYNGRIDIFWDENTRRLDIWDNGTGMTYDEIEKYLLTVGSSRYSAKEFKQVYKDFSPISKFGIGILTCFLIADDLDIITSTEREEKGNMVAIRKVDGRYLIRKINKNELDNKIRNHGTHISLSVRRTSDMNDIISKLKKWILLPACAVHLHIQNQEYKIGYNSTKEALISFLNEAGFSSNNCYRVQAEEINGVDIAYIQKYNIYQHEWNFCGFNDLFLHADSYVAMGTCIEGIRVEFTTPGFKSNNIIALANIRNHQPQINVARSSMEWEENSYELLGSIYRLYVHEVNNQLEALKKQGYSDDWIASEADYLTSKLIKNYQFNRRFDSDEISPINLDILLKELGEIKCIIIEEAGCRMSYSINQIRKMENITIVDSKMMQAAESLLREVKSSASLKSLFYTLVENDNISKKRNLICNFNQYSYLHTEALVGKQVKSIKVTKSQREIELYFTSESTQWESFRLGDGLTVLIPTEKVEITGLEDEIGIKSMSSIYLSFENAIAQYVLNIKEKFNYKNSKEDLQILCCLLNCIFDERVLRIKPTDSKSNKEKLFDNLIDNSRKTTSRELLSKAFERIDKQELIDLLFSQEYHLYTTSDWYRNHSGYDEWEWY